MSASPPQLVADLSAALTRGGQRDAEEIGIVEDFLTRAQHAWPDVDAVSSTSLLGALEAARVRSFEDLAACDAGELWLAAACTSGDATALAGFERKYIAPLDRPLQALHLESASIDDIKQRVRQRLLTAAPDQPIRLLEYAGKGRLFGLVKVVAIRISLDDKKRQARAPDRRSADARTVERVMDGAVGPEFAAIEAEHRAAIKGAFEAAIAALSPKERGVLRLHLLEGSSIDEIAALHDVHRATAARWLVGIRQALAKATHRTLQTELGVDDERLQSLLRAVDSRIDLSFSRLLAATTASHSSSTEP